MRNRVSMRFARLRHVQHDDEAPAVKISAPTLKHSSVAFSTGSTHNLDALSALEGRSARSQGKATSASTTSSSGGALLDTPVTPKTPKRGEFWAPNSPGEDTLGTSLGASGTSKWESEFAEYTLRTPDVSKRRNGSSTSTSYTTLHSPPGHGASNKGTPALSQDIFYDALSSSSGATEPAHRGAGGPTESSLPRDDSFADVLRGLDGLGELEDDPALVPALGPALTGRSPRVSDDPNWPDLEMHASDEVYLPKTPRRTSSRQFVAEDKGVGPRTSSKGRRSVAPLPPLPPALPANGGPSHLQTELAQLRKELEDTKSELARERGENRRLRERPVEPSQKALSAAPGAPVGPVAAVASPSAAAAAAAATAAFVQLPQTSAPAQPAPAQPAPAARNSNSIEEYKQALARLNVIRALQIQERDARIALLEAALLREKMPTPLPPLEALGPAGAMPENGGRIPRMRMLLPVE